MNALKESYMRGKKAEESAEKMGTKNKNKIDEKYLERATIEKADNDGFIVRCAYETKVKKGGGNGNMAMPPTEYEDKEFVFKNSDELMDFLGDMFEA